MFKNLKKYIYILVLMFISFIFLFMASYSTSPLYKYSWGGDSAQFQTMGFAWANGKIPYTQVFDHKGPLIFFVNMLGYIFGGKEGVFFIQCIFMFFTLLGISKIVKLATDRVEYKVIIILFAIATLAKVIEDGNLCEEYCLPFLCFSTFGQLDYLKNFENNSKHDIKWGLFYGITVSVGICTRATNAIGVAGGVLLISILLIYKKQFTNLLYNALAFICGVALIILPFAIYFAVNGAFEDFIFGTLLFNFSYINQKEAWFNIMQLSSWKEYYKLFFPSAICIHSIVLAIVNKEKYISVYCLITAILEMWLFCSGSAYRHYAIIALPNAAIFGIEVIKLIKNDNKAKKILGILAITWMCCFVISSNIKLYNFAVEEHETYKIDNKGYKELIKQIPKEDYPYVAVYGLGSLKDFYLRYNIVPCYKYFVLQDSHGRFNEEVKKDIYNTFSKCEAKYILTDEHTEIIDDILDKYYTNIGVEEKYTLYKINVK